MFYEVWRAQFTQRKEIPEGTTTENIGVYKEIFSAKSSIDGQDGGIVTALLISGIRKGFFDSVIVVQRKGGYSAESFATDNADDIMAARGTKYLKVRVASKMRESISQGKGRIAIVCTPCEVRAARRILQNLKSDSSKQKVIIIGLFCFEAFNRAKLKEEVRIQLGIDLDKVDKIQIRNGKFKVFLDMKEYTCRVKDLDNAVEKECKYCDDFSGRLADVSIGAVGSRNGYSTVIVRSEVGRKLLQNLDFDKENTDKEEIIKISKLKEQRAKKNHCSLQPSTA